MTTAHVQSSKLLLATPGMSPSQSRISMPPRDDADRPEKPTTRLQATREYPPKIKLLACVGLVIVQVVAAIMMKIAQKDGVYAFSPESSLVMSESIKTIMSAAYLLVETNRSPALARSAIIDQSSRPLIVHLLGLAALYCFNNNIMFWLFARADPGSISLIKSGGTIVSAVLMYLWRRFRLSLPRWMVIVVQMLGLVVAQYDPCKHSSILSPTVYAVLFLSLINSSIANVWNEHVIKSFEHAGLAVKNLYLYLFGAVLNLLVFAYCRAAVSSTPSFFEGYNLIAMSVVTSNAFIGIAMNAVYKYADALVKNVATTTTTVVLLVVSAFFFAGRGGVMVFVGTSVVIVGTFLYFLLGSSEARLAELKRKLEPEDEH